MDRLAQRWLPNWGWDYYRWVTNYRRVRERFANFKEYRAYEQRFRHLMRGDK